MFRLSNLDGANGFVINGVDSFFKGSGSSVSGAGDVNGDGVDDLLIGAPTAPGYNWDNRYFGKSFVVFGGDWVGNTNALELSDLNGANGFEINSTEREQWDQWHLDKPRPCSTPL